MVKDVEIIMLCGICKKNPCHGSVIRLIDYNGIMFQREICDYCDAMIKFTIQNMIIASDSPSCNPMMFLLGMLAGSVIAAGVMYFV